MKKVEYPKDIDSLKDRYIASFDSKKLVDIENAWTLFKSNNPEVAYITKNVKEIMLMDFKELLGLYTEYISKVSPAKRKEFGRKDEPTSLYKSVFDYDSWGSHIRSFFADPANGFNIHTCHYCESAYINSYKVEGDDLILYRINSSPEKEIENFLYLAHRGKAKAIFENAPYKTLDELKSFVDLTNFKKDFHDDTATRVMRQFDLDHVLDKASCPLVALSLMNFVPCCSVCNSRLKHSAVQGRMGLPDEKLSPTSNLYKFDEQVEIRLHSRTGCTYNNPLQHQSDFYIEFETDDPDYGYEIGLFKLKERYNYHIAEALRLLKLKQKYSDSAIQMISNSLPDRARYSAVKIKEDIFGVRFSKTEHRVFDKMKRDIMNQLDCSTKL